MMKIVFCASEASPYAKVGGLGDVVGSLPLALQGLGHEVSVFIPRYGFIDLDECQAQRIEPALVVHHPEHGQETFGLYKTHLWHSGVDMYFIDHPALFGRSNDIYPWQQPDWEMERFEWLCLATKTFLEVTQNLPHIIHCHDWHTSPLLYYIRQHQPDLWHKTASILTVHNMAYQGILADKNWLRTGLTYADQITTVSPSYAKEVLEEPNGCGLSKLLYQNHDKLTGILNGIDLNVFNPETDKFLDQPYTLETAHIAKPQYKQALQKELGLDINPKIPLIAMVSRLVEQKGLDLIIDAHERLSTLPLQLIILGQGDPNYESTLTELNRHSDNVRYLKGFLLALSQRAYAAADAFLMPSRFEPCGLGQLIAMRYGTLPIVHSIGGLKDTVIDLFDNPSQGTGFAFQYYSAYSLIDVIEKMLIVWHYQPYLWQLGIRNAMSQDFSWDKSALAYQAIYEKAVFQHRFQ